MHAKREKPSKDFLVALGFAIVTFALVGFAVVKGTESSEPVSGQIFGALFLSVFPVVFGRAAYKSRPRPATETEFEHGTPSQQKVEALFDIGKYNQAEVGAKALVSSEPGNVAAHEALALSLLAKGETRKAQAAATDALHVDPSSLTALHVRAKTHLALNERPKASTDLRSALALAPTNAELLNEQALLHLATHDASIFRTWTRAPFVSPYLKRAQSVSRQGLSHRPDHPELLCTLSFIQLLLGQSEKSLETALAAASADPSSSTVRFRVGCAQIGCGQVETGVRTLVKLVAQDQTMGPDVSSEFGRLGKFSGRAKLPEELRENVALVRRTFRRSS